MSYSSQVNKKIPVKSCSKRTAKIDSIAIQCCCSNMTINALGDAFKNESNKTSTNYGIDSKGKIAVYVDEDDAAWGMSNSAINNRCVSIMMASSTDQAPYACSQDALNALVMLTADICIRNNISGLRWNDDEGYAKKAANGGPVQRSLRSRIRIDESYS